MLSLIVTALLGLFCCSSINYNTIDSSSNSEIIESIDNKPQIKNAQVNTNGDGNITEGWYFQGDLLDYLFFLRLGESMVNTLSQPDFAINNTNNASYRFNNVNGYFTPFDTNFTVTQKTVTSISFNKTYLDSFVLDNQTIYNHRYTLAFYEPNFAQSMFTIRYDVTGPFGFTFAVKPYISYDKYNIGSWQWCYYENNNGVLGPLSTYGYQEVYTRNLFGVDTYITQGYNDGYWVGFNDGKTQGYQSGYNQGLLDGTEYDDTALTIFTGIIQVGLLPVNVFLQILNFEVFGINIAGFVSALLTISIVIIVIRVITGKKND